MSSQEKEITCAWAEQEKPLFILLHISSPPPPVGFALCQDHCVDRSWLLAGAEAQHRTPHRTLRSGKNLLETASRAAVTKGTVCQWGRRGRALLRWWLDFTPQAPSQTTPQSLKALVLKLSQMCHHSSGRATMLMTYRLRWNRTGLWGSLCWVTLDITPQWL